MGILRIICNTNIFLPMVLLLAAVVIFVLKTKAKFFHVPAHLLGEGKDREGEMGNMREYRLLSLASLVREGVKGAA